MPKQREHNEWFKKVSRGNRKSCSNCRVRLPQGESIWSWGEYHNVKWRTIQDCCINCFPEIRKSLNSHTSGCGCTVNIICKSDTKPDWMTL